MPITRSMKSFAINDPPASSAATPTENSVLTDATAPTTEGTTTTISGTTAETTTSTDATTATQPKAIRAPSAPRSKASSMKRRKELARAREELLKKEIELAAARVAYLEEESEEDEEDNGTIRNEWTEDWVQKNTLALTMEPHTKPSNEEPEMLPPNREKSNMNTQTTPPCARKIATYNQSNFEQRANETAIPSGEQRVKGTATSPDQHRARETAPYTEQRRVNETTRSFDYQELATAITQAARTIPTSSSKNIELPIFNGASSEWLPFKTAYEETENQLSEQENLARLRRSLRGAAKEATHCLFVGSTSAREVLKLLASRFGRPDALVMAEMNKLRALPRLTENPKDICIFASKILNITATVKALKKHHYLYNSEVVRGVVEKLPSALRYRYYDFAAEQPEDQPDLITLSKFLELTAERCGSFAPAEAITVEDRREQPSRKMRNYASQEQSFNIAPQTCVLCGREGHQLLDCYNLKKADVPARWELAKKHRLCFRCMKIRKFKHSCKPKRCDVNGCTYLHHPLLHAEPSASPQQKNEATAFTIEQIPVATVTSTRETQKTAYLKILPVQLDGPRGTYKTYALLDDGSTCTLIEESIAKIIGAHGPAEPFFIEGVAGARVNATQSKRVHIKIRGHNNEAYEISARTVSKLNLSPQTVPRRIIETCIHLRDIEKELTYTRGQPTVLVGQDNWHLLLTHEVRKGRKSQPVASLTDLGWVLHGTEVTRKKSSIHTVSHVTTYEEEEEPMEKIMREHFSLDSLGIEPKKSYNDLERRAMKILEEKTRRLPSGGYETGLLWKRDDICPPNSYDTALRRLHSIEKKLDKDEGMKRRYTEQMNNLLRNGYAEVAPTQKNERHWYLPHFAVINPQKPEKLRIVHDAAAKSRGTSLNDLLLSGPDLLQSLPGVLMRFRQRKIAVTADIKDMFLRVNIREDDRDMQRFLWRGDRREGPPTEYRMKSVIFGATSSPCTAIYIKNKNAEEYKEQFPDAASAIVSNHYVDDYLASFNTEEEAIKISKQVDHIHRQAEYCLQRWASNSRKVRAEFCTTDAKHPVELDSEKILGLVWRPEKDSLSFNINTHKIPPKILSGEKVPTKREALRTVMSLFDPLGLATPVTIQAKKILQETWRTGIEWDEELQSPEIEKWHSWVKHIQQLPNLAIPRSYPYFTASRSVELHTFVDASSSVYACAIYWRTINNSGEVNVTLVAAKGRVAPINKLTSIPRLELQAAVLGCRLARTVIEEHDVKPVRRIYWSDSRTVLTWLRTGPRAYKPFVAHRVAEISEETKTKEWRWVPTSENVADDATRDTPRDFDTEHRWFRGPDFLYLPEDQWPSEKIEDVTDHVHEVIEEERVNIAAVTTCLSSSLPDPKRFSSWVRLMRVTARILQFIENLRSRNKMRCAAIRKRNKKIEDVDPTWKQIKNISKAKSKTKSLKKNDDKYLPIETHHMNQARQLWIRATQEDSFRDELASLRDGKNIPTSSRLIQLSLILDGDDIMRIRSRIAVATDVSSEQKEPPVVDGDHPWVRLYIAWIHRKLHHGGFETTANEVRQNMWVIRLRHSVRTEVKKCMMCRIRRARPAQPSTGNHPKSRLAHHQRPFTFTGLDYFGPMNVTVGRSTQKRYGVLFTCLTTRAVHLELAHSLSTDSAVMVIRRFISRRGCPTELWSDQGTNLKGADHEMQQAALAAMKEEASIRFITWRFIPPSAPFMGGAWERLVRSVKTALATTLQERAPNEEVLATLLVEVEHTVNSRPLTHVSTSSDDECALTPNHFLLGGPSRVPLPGAFTEGDAAGRKQWRASQRLADTFWNRWVKEYLPELQHRREPRAKGALKLHDLVLIADGTLPRNSWPRGVVVATYPGPDGEVRAVDVRTRRGILRRPTKKLVILPAEKADDANSE